MCRKVSVSAIQKTVQFAQVSKPLSQKPVRGSLTYFELRYFLFLFLWVICDMHNADIVKVLLIQKVSKFNPFSYYLSGYERICFFPYTRISIGCTYFSTQ